MIKKLISSIFKILVLSSFGIAQANAQATTAGILPLAQTQFLDQNGNPLTSGKVYFYVPGTTTAKTTWKDINEATPNTNPVNLDAGGRALIWGNGSYRQQVYDRNNNLIWDQTTASAGSGSSGSTIGDGLPVGTILQSSGLIAPTNYQFAYGQTLSRSLFPQLLAALTITSNITCTGGSPTITNIADTSSISVGTALEAACVTGNPTVISKTSTTVTLNSNANISFTSAGTFYPYGNGDGLTTFNVPDYRGYVVAGRCNMGGVDCLNVNSTYFSSNANNTPSSLNAKGGSQSSVLVASNLPPHTHTSPTLTDPGHTHTQTIFQQLLGGLSGSGNGWSASTTANTGNSTTGITLSANTGTNASGTSTPLSIMQPTVTANYIIKVTPDSNLTSTFGVASIGGMTGIISCGANVVCAGNTISVPTVGGFGNPSSLVGLTAINGALGTAMRSDAAPALSQAIAPNWTGRHTYTTASNQKLLTATGNAGGSGGTNGTAVYALVGGTGTAATLNITIAGGVLSSINSIASAGNYTVFPTSPAALTYVSGTGTGLTGATVNITSGPVAVGGIIAIGAPTITSGYQESQSLFDTSFDITAANNTTPETSALIHMLSNTGSANLVSAFKRGLSVATECNSGSASCWGQTIATQIGNGGTQRGGINLELDLNSFFGNFTGQPANPYAANLVITGQNNDGAGHGGYASCAICVEFAQNASPMWNFGAHFGPAGFQVFNTATIEDITNSPTSILISGTHSLYGIDLQSGLFTTGAIRLPNNQSIVARNAANNADQLALILTSSNVLLVGDTSHDIQIAPHNRLSGLSPTITSGCGTSGQAITSGSTDTAGEILLGSAGLTNTCTVAWANNYNSKPFCVFQDQNLSSIAIGAAASTTGFVISNGSGASAGGHTISYVCYAKSTG